MAYRVFLQVVVTGSQVVSRAFVEAFKQARSASVAATATAAAREKFGGIELGEARKILGLEDGPLNMEGAQKKYDYLFDANSKEKSGSFYLQSKVYRAMERIKYELGELDNAKKAPESGSAETKPDTKPKE